MNLAEVEVVKSNDLEIAQPTPAIIKVVGCGGGGSSAVNRMVQSNIEQVQFIVLNTDLQALNRSIADVKVPIGQKLTGGLGAGGNPEIGQKAAEEDREAIKNQLAGANMVFVTAGMGGGTGTGSAPIVAEIAKELGALTVGVVTTPFDFEGPVRMQLAQEGIEKLRQYVDSLVVIPNTTLIKMDDDITMKDAYQRADEVLHQGVEGISSIIVKAGEINTDFADVRATMSNQGDALLGIGFGKGENRAIDAATNAINNPLLENMNINGAKTFLINITTNNSLKLRESNEIAKLITASASSNYRVFFGEVINPEMADDELSVTVIATGFSSNSKKDSVTENNLQKSNSGNVVDPDEFNKILGGGIGDFVTPKNSPVSKKEDVDIWKDEDSFLTNKNHKDSELSFDEEVEKVKERSLGEQIGLSHQQSLQSSRGVNPPSDFSADQNDFDQPACWRSASKNLSREINLQR